MVGPPFCVCFLLVKLGEIVVQIGRIAHDDVMHECISFLNLKLFSKLFVLCTTNDRFTNHITPEGRIKDDTKGRRPKK